MTPEVRPDEVPLTRRLTPEQRKRRYNLLQRHDVALGRIALAVRLIVEIERELAHLGGPKRRRGTAPRKIASIRDAIDHGIRTAKDRVTW